jgi:hypothetical protein
MSNEAKIQHKIGDAVLTEEGASQLANWQEYENANLQDMVCNLLKAVSFMACTASSYAFREQEKAESMNHIINLSETAKIIEIFKK